jgi:hypothetical protein
MSDTPLGDGWWLASDGKYYPPAAPAPATAPTTAPDLGQPKRRVGKWAAISAAGIVGVSIIGSLGGASDKKTTLEASSVTSEVAATEPTTAAPQLSATPSTTGAPKAVVSTTEAPTTTEPPTTTAKPTTTTEAPKPQFSVSQINAKRKASSYLDMTAFSRKGLIEQLKYEGFSEPDATFGVDSLNADWNEQAALKGKSYLEMTAFSHSGLVEQLEYEGFTPEQAEYGASANHL